MSQGAQARSASTQAAPRRPLPGMLLHIDGSRHQWFQDDRWYDLLVILDDATSRIYYAQLVEEESTMTVLAGCGSGGAGRGFLRPVQRPRQSLLLDARAGGKVDPERLTQVGRALQELGIRMIPAYSPQARGRSERSFGTWQGRLPQELRLRGMSTLEQANAFLASNTWPSSISDSRCRRRRVARFCRAKEGSGCSFRCSTSGW